MIVKNEARVIRRCLDSVAPHVQRWLIVDTGSTDGTQDIIRAHMKDVPGELVERPWKNFGHNRSEALSLAREGSDYLLVIDADERLVVPPGFRWPALEADDYLVACQYEGSPTIWYRTTLLKASLPWRYEGVVHEFPTCDRERNTGKLPGPSIVSHTDGARNANEKEKFASDARLLEQALKEDPTNARNAYYLAQSYRGAGEVDRAIAAYEHRATMGGWYEEVYGSLFSSAALRHEAGHDWPSVSAAYLRAYQFHPRRAEPLCALATRHRLEGEWALAELFARAAAGIARPDDIFLVDDSVYDWRAADELAIATYYVGKYAESEALCRKLLSNPKLPASERERVEANLRFALGARGPDEQKRKNEKKRERKRR
jgi:tetratricopeptide (TPR) repeat protein